MSNTISPRFNISLLGGEGEVTRLEKSYPITLSNKLERSFNLKLSSETIEFQDVENPSVVIFEGSGEFIVTFTLASTDAITFPVKDSFSMVLSSSFFDTLSTIVVSEANDINRKINIRIYGEVAA